MKDDLIPDEDHVSRYCSPARVENGRPMASAFEIRSQDHYLSVNWLEYWLASDLDAAVDCVRGELVVLEIKPDGAFAVLNVAAVKAAVDQATRRQSSTTHQPTLDMESHAGVFGFFHSDIDAPAALAEIVAMGNVFPAVVVAS